MEFYYQILVGTLKTTNYLLNLRDNEEMIP